LAVSACQRAPKPKVDTHGALLAAAESFENLTEAAFSANAEVVAAANAKADGAVRSIIPVLSADQKAQLNQITAAMVEARKSANATDVSLTANELLRFAIVTASGEKNIPVEVSLLDYSGFRYMANAKAQPVRWADMTVTVDDAANHWTKVKPQFKDPQLVAKFDTVLADMRAAITAKDTAKARTVGNQELDLVDLLESAAAAK
jgi:hypothetical protein